MKKSIAFLLAALMLALAGCVPGGGPAGESDAPARVVDYRIDVPEGFEPTEAEGLDACWSHEDGSSINLTITDKDEVTDRSFQDASDGLLRDTLEKVMKNAYGSDLEFTDRFFTQNEVSGFTAYQYSYELELPDWSMIQLIVAVNADRTYTFTFTDNGGWIGTFEESAAGIQLVTE